MSQRKYEIRSLLATLIKSASSNYILGEPESAATLIMERFDVEPKESWGFWWEDNPE